MNVYEEIKTGLEEAIAYEKQSITDKEIKKALECCIKEDYEKITNALCAKCPYCKNTNCKSLLQQDVIDYINRLEAENERLTADLKTTKNVIKNTFLEKAGFDIDPLAEIKTEARKEFAERLNKEAEKVEIDQEGDFVEADNKIYDTVATWCKTTSDNILKEMESENNGNN